MSTKSRTRFLVPAVAFAFAVAFAPTASAIPPCLDAGPSVTVSSATLGASVTVTDPNCYVWGAPWYSLYDSGVPSHVWVALP